MTSLAPPVLTVRQLLRRRTAVTGRRLLPFLLGSLAETVRYSIASEKPNGLLGAYDDSPATVAGTPQTLYDWPNRPTGNKIDLAFTRLFIENANARYFHDTAHTATKTGSNSVRCPSKVFKNAAGAVGNVIDSDVRPGDRVRIKGVLSDDSPFTLSSYVVDLRGDTVAATVDVPVAASTNRQATNQAGSTASGSGNQAPTALGLSGGGYNGQKVGLSNDVYTITITTGGAAGVARFSAISASGRDNAYNILIPDYSVSIPFGIAGMEVGFLNNSEPSFSVGDTWTATVTTYAVVPDLTVAGTYTGTTDRTYLVEVVKGDNLLGNNVQIQVSGQDGTDSSLPITVPSTSPVALGSYGLTIAFDADTGLMKGDKWLVAATAAHQGTVRTLLIANDLPTDMETDNTALLEIELFKRLDFEIPAQSATPGIYNFVGEAEQLRVRGGLTTTDSNVKLNGTPITMPILSIDEFAGTNSLYVQYRSWYPPSTDLYALDSETDLDLALEGPIDPDNPLKYAVSLCRLGAVGETIYTFNVGDPSDLTNWQKALDTAARNDLVYGYVPLTQDPDVINLVQAAIATANGERQNNYRVGWFTTPKLTGKVLVDSTTTTDHQVALATVSDNSLATGTQLTQLRITSANLDLQQLGVRAGDTIRYMYSVDGWGNEIYATRTVASVRSAEVLIVTTPFDSEESLPRRVEIHRQYNTGELRDSYANSAASRASILVRQVIAPEVLIGSYTLPGYYLAVILAGMRAAIPAQQILSTVQVPGVLGIGGLEQFSSADLNIIAGSGGFICIYDYRLAAVKIRHAITTGTTEILAEREESMVSARHAALFAYNERLNLYVGQVNIRLGDDDQFATLAEQIRGELRSTTNELQTRDYTVEFGGLVRDLTDVTITPSAIAQDELLIRGTLSLGRPGNDVTFEVTIV